MRDSFPKINIISSLKPPRETHILKWMSLLSSEASRYLVEVLEAVSPSEVDDVIERVLDAVEKQPCE